MAMSAISQTLRRRWLYRRHRRSYAFPAFVAVLIVLVSIALIMTAK
jgi:hypothetical protein